MASPLVSFILTALQKPSRLLYRDFFELELQQSSQRPMNSFAQKSYDRTSELLLSDLGRYANLGVIGSLTNESPVTGRVNFAIIPVSGIINLRHALPIFSTIICAYQLDEKSNKIPIAAVIDFPALGETYSAEKGGGAWMERHIHNTGSKAMRLRVSMRKNEQIVISDAAGAGGRNFGDDAYAVCLLAAGKIDSVKLASVDPVIALASEVFTREAGGAVLSINHLILSNSQ